MTRPACRFIHVLFVCPPREVAGPIIQRVAVKVHAVYIVVAVYMLRFRPVKCLANQHMERKAFLKFTGRVAEADITIRSFSIGVFIRG